MSLKLLRYVVMNPVHLLNPVIKELIVHVTTQKWSIMYSTKHWRIWWLVSNPPMFYPPNTFWAPICQSFLPPKFCVYFDDYFVKLQK